MASWQLWRGLTRPVNSAEAFTDQICVGTLPLRGHCLLPCLAGLEEVTDRKILAKTLPCLHIFCVECLEQWAERKRACALCRVRALLQPPAQQSSPGYRVVGLAVALDCLQVPLEGYLHDIRSDRDYKEVIFSPQVNPPDNPPPTLTTLLQSLTSALGNAAGPILGGTVGAGAVGAGPRSSGPLGQGASRRTRETDAERVLRELEETLHALGERAQGNARVRPCVGQLGLSAQQASSASSCV